MHSSHKCFHMLQQELTLTNERFLVPEMLFHPADLGKFLYRLVRPLHFFATFKLGFPDDFELIFSMRLLIRRRTRQFAGMNEAGLAECVVRAINACEPELHPLLYRRYVFCMAMITSESLE